MEIFDLYDIPDDVISFCGGKAARLCQMHKAGFPVPPGFILYQPSSDQDIEEAAVYFEKSALSAAAVRSSASIEDGSSFSSAGQYETVLNVSGADAFRKAVRTCLNSLHSKEAESYNAFWNKDKKDNVMTIVVQQMVNARCAGVAFSKDPLNPDEVLIEAVSGLGESLVSGKEKADSWHIGKDSSVRAEGSLLSEKEALAIRDAVLHVEQTFGFTADVEWAIDRDGEIRFLQVRPVTTENLPTPDEFDYRPDLTGHVVTNCNISEMMPGAITPLTMTTSAYGLDWGLRKLLLHAGVYHSEEEIPPYSCYFTLGGHLFGDLTPIYAIAKTMVMASKESIDLSICGRILDSEVPDVPSPSLPKRVRNFYRYISSVMARKKACEDAERIASSLKIPYGKTPEETYAAICSNMQDLMDIMYDHYITSAFSGMMSSALNLQLAPFFDDEMKQHAAVAACLVDIPGIENADLLTRLYELSKAIRREYPETEYTPEMVQNAVKNGSRNIQDLYSQFMKKHGHRSIDECEIRQKSLCDDPETFYQQLAMICNAPEKKETEGSWQDSRKKLLEQVPKTKAFTFKMLIKYAREGVRVREYTKSRIVKATYIFKKAYEHLAEQMLEQGLLPDPDCICFLTHEEIGKILQGKENTLGIRAMQRRRLYPEQQALKFPDVTFGRPVPLKADAARPAENDVLKGTPVSRGIIEGPAHIVKSVSDANELKPGDIMVAEFTDTGWTPYYSQAGGLVTEIGAAISHGAVVAREYGLPLVSNISCATDLIHEGDWIRIDGSAGTVTIL